MYAFANLDPEKLEALREFESRRGYKVLALSEVDVTPADLDDGTLADLKRLEETLGMTLVAVRE